MSTRRSLDGGAVYSLELLDEAAWEFAVAVDQVLPGSLQLGLGVVVNQVGSAQRNCQDQLKVRSSAIFESTASRVSVVLVSGGREFEPRSGAYLKGKRSKTAGKHTKISAAVITRPAMKSGQPDLEARHKSSLPSPGAHLLLLAVSLAPLVLPVHANALIILTASLTVWVGSCRSIKPEPPSESMTKQVEQLDPQKH